MRSKAISMALLAFAFAAHGGSVSRETAETAACGWVRGGGMLGARIGSQVESSAEHATTNGAVFYSVKMWGGGTVFMSSDTEIEPVVAFTDSEDDFSEIDPKSPLWALLNRDVSARRAAIDSRPVVLLRPNSSGSSSAGSSAVQGGSSTADKWAALVERGSEPSVSLKPLLSAAPRAASPGDLRVPALMVSEWDQAETDGGAHKSDARTCYNYYTPQDMTGVIQEGKKENAVCGCVATAMGQLMFYHGYPASANASAATDNCWFSEYDIYGKVTGTASLSLPVSGDPYDWNSMVASPMSGATLATRKAIGRLVSDAGRSVGMAYSSNDSGSFTFKASKSLCDVFRFGQSVYAEFAGGYSTVGPLTGDTVRRVVYANLDAGYPVIFGISGSKGGHEIVADGYGYQGATPYVHLNMGWSGECDVWYNLPNIDTTSSGGSFVFNVVDDAAYNVIPDGAGLGVMSGRVVDDDGEPIADAVVSVYDAGTDAPVTQLVTTAYGVWGVALPAGSGRSYKVVVVDAENARSGETTATLKSPVQSGANFAWVTPKYEMTKKDTDAGFGTYPVVKTKGDLGNSWGNDVTLENQRVMVVDGSGTTNFYPTLDAAISGARQIAAADGIAPVMEILGDVRLKADATIDFDCVLRATNAVSAAVVNRPSGAAITVASGAALLASNCVFAATGRAPLAVEAGGRVYVGPGFAAERVSTADASGFNVVGYVTSDIAVECAVATAIGQVFGHATTDDPSALGDSVERIYSAFDASLETRGALLELAPSSYNLVWTGAPVPVGSAAAYYVDIYGATNTSAHVGDIFAMFKSASDAGLVGPSPEIVIVGQNVSGASRFELVVSSGLTIRGEGETVISPDIYSHIVVTNGGSLVLRDITFSGRESDTFIRVLGGGTMTLGSGATLANLGCTANLDMLAAGPVYVTNGVLRLETGSKISGCSATGTGGYYGGNLGGGVYLDCGATLDLAGGVIENCSASTYGGGVYANMGATVVVSGPSRVKGNVVGKKGRSDDVYFLVGGSYTNRFRVTNTDSATAASIGVRYSDSSFACDGFVFAEAEDALAASQTAQAFFSDDNASLVATVANATEIAWFDPASGGSVGPAPVDPSDPGAMASAVAKVDYPDSSTEYWYTLQDAFASLEGKSGHAKVTLLADGWILDGLAVSCDVELVSSSASAWDVVRYGNCSVVVAEGASLSVSNVVFTDSAAVVAKSPMFLVAGGSLEFLDGAKVCDVAAYGSFGSAVTVTVGEHVGGTFTMHDGAVVQNCRNDYEYVFDGTAYAGGLFVAGANLEGTILTAKAYLLGGTITGCAAYRSGGVYVGSRGELHVSGDVDVVGNSSTTNGVAASAANVTVSANAALVLDDAFSGDVGVHRDIAAEGVVFGRIGDSFSGSAADCVDSAMNFTSDDGYGYGVPVSANGSGVATHLAWSGKLGVDGTYTDRNGVVYTLVSDSSVLFPVDPPTAAAGLVYNGGEQTGVVGLRGYALSGVVSASAAGTYVATATLLPGYVWSDSSTAAKDVVWTIAKASYDMGGIAFVDRTFVYDGAPKSLGISGKLPDGVAVAYVGNSQSAPGAYTVTASFSSEDVNYLPIPDMTATLTILKSVAEPVAAEGLVYNAAPQTGVAAGAGYALSGDATGTDAGTNYTAVASLDEYCTWPDGSTNDLEIVWSISPAPLSIAAADAWKYLGDDDPLPFKYAVVGLQGDDKAEDVLVGELDRVREGEERQGTVHITQGTLRLKDGVRNYTISEFSGGRLSILDKSSPPPEPPTPTPVEPLPVAFTAVADGSGTWTLTITTAVEKCWYSLYETNSLSGGFKIYGVEPVTNRQATAGDVPTMSFERPANGSQLFWRIRAEPSDAH